MAPSGKGDLTASMAILGLVVRKADTLEGIKARMDAYFPHAGWSSSVAYSGVEGLEIRGLVAVCSSAEQRALDYIEATALGAASFRAWLREGSMATRVLRDAIRVKLAFCEEGDLPDQILALGEEQRFCEERFEAAHLRRLRAGRMGQLGPFDGSDERGRLRHVLLVDEAMVWGQRALRLKRLREELEGIDDDLSAPR
jgi:hypothetical protein